jgi:hypothetical protein
LPSSADARFGLDEADAFRLAPGGEASATAGPQAAWYFANELVALPRTGGAGFARETRPLHDVRRWSEAHARAPRELPPLVWAGTAQRVRHARLDADARAFAAGGASWPLAFVERLPTNSAWFDARSAAWFTQRDANLCGDWRDGTFVARALWPSAWRLGPQPAPSRELPATGAPGAALRALMRSVPEDPTAYSASSLWQREAGATWRGKAVVAFLVNGAQGDDDEAHAGHFSIATGRIADNGDIGEWLVDSFYSLDVVSEKGILAAPVPLDRYQGDLNSGQSWYRPSWALVAVLDDERAAVRVQSALGRLYRHFWRGQLAYYHPTDNCTSIAVDALRALGLDVPLAGPTAQWKAWLALPWLIVKERSLAKARPAFDYIVTERTRLFPAIALEAVFTALWSLAHRHGPAPTGALGRELGADLVALAWLDIPQLPSSRARGAAPVVALDEYRARVPADPAERKIIPLPPRTLPEALREADLLPQLPHPSDLALRWWAVIPLALAALVLVLRVLSLPA